MNFITPHGFAVSFSSIRLIIALSITLCSPWVKAATVLVSADKYYNLEVYTNIWSGGSGQSQVGFEEYNVNRTSSILGATATVQHLSFFQPEQISASQIATATASTFDGPITAEAHAISSFQVTFIITEATPFILTGDIATRGGGIASLQLMSSTGLVPLAFEPNAYFSIMGILPPDTYNLKAFVKSGAVSQHIGEYNTTSSHVSFHFDTRVPDSGSSILLLAFGVVTALAIHRRVIQI
jgi:hypothetical protein